MSSHWHDPTAQTQNQGNRVGDRPCVRQSKLYRRYESGNQIKEMLGQGSLLWDEEKQQGAYAGQRVYDHLTADHSMGMGSPKTVARSSTFHGRPSTAGARATPKHQGSPAAASYRGLASRAAASPAVAASWNGGLNTAAPPKEEPSKPRRSHSPAPLARGTPFARSASAFSISPPRKEMDPSKDSSKAELKQLREEVRRLQRELDQDSLAVEVRGLRKENAELHAALDAVSPEDLDDLELLRFHYAQMEEVTDAYEEQLRSLAAEHKFDFTPRQRPQRTRVREGGKGGTEAQAAAENKTGPVELTEAAAAENTRPQMQSEVPQGGRERRRVGVESGENTRGEGAGKAARGARRFVEGERVGLRWRAPGSGEESLWPGRVVGKRNFVRVRIVSPDQRMQLMDAGEPRRIEIANEGSRLETAAAAGSEGVAGRYRHTVVLTAATDDNMTVTHTLRVTNSKSRYRPGDTLSFPLTQRVPGLPVWYAVEFEGGAGRRDDVEAHALAPAPASLRAPSPRPWPPCGVLSGGERGESELVWRNGNPSSSGAALHVQVCADDDDGGGRAAAVIFVHPDDQAKGARLPPGKYHTWVGAAATRDEEGGDGGEYYGERHLFGPAGRYFSASEVRLAASTSLTVDFMGGNDTMPLEHVTW